MRISKNKKKETNYNQATSTDSKNKSFKQKAIDKKSQENSSPR